MADSNYHIEYLQSELQRRRKRNALYSLRAYARDLDIDPGTLSLLMKGKRPFTLKLIEKLCRELKLKPDDREDLFISVALCQSSRGLRRRDPKIEKWLLKRPQFRNPRRLDADVYAYISGWHHMAILEMTYLENFKADPTWIAKELGLTKKVAAASLSRLFKLKLLEEVGGRVRKTNDHLEVADTDKTSKARKLKQKAIRRKSIQSIDQDPIEKRHMSSITMCIDPKLIPEARRKIEEFNNSLCAFLESKKRKQVYVMEIGFFPLQKNKKEGAKNGDE